MGEGATAVDEDGKVLLQFVDLHGIPRGAFVPGSRWERARETGGGFTAMVMDVYETRTGRGTVHPIEYGPESEEATAVPDASTLVPIPWSEPGSYVAQCRLERGTEPFELCSRTTLESVLSDLEYRVEVGAEVEFTLFGDRSPTRGDGNRDEGLSAGALDDAAVNGPRPYDARSLEAADAYVSELVDALDAMDYGVESVQRESSPGQFEVSLTHGGPLEATDGVVLTRQAIRGVGRNHGYDATFMPFPVPEYEGNGLHFHVDLQDGTDDAFLEESDEYGLSTVGYQFIGGVLRHADALTAVCAPTVNSYKRFRPGTFAPVDRTYGFENRSAMVRIPRSAPENRRIEVRLPDSYANPYLALAAIVAAGADGIRSGDSPDEPDDPDRYAAADEDRALPGSLSAALDALEDDDVVRSALGEDLVSQFCKLKRDELERFHGAVTDWEVDEYVDRL